MLPLQPPKPRLLFPQDRFGLFGEGQVIVRVPLPNPLRLPALFEPQGLEGKAMDRGPLPTRTNYQPILEGMCKA